MKKKTATVNRRASRAGVKPRRTAPRPKAKAAAKAPKAPALVKLKTILVPVDFSPPIQKALRYARSLAELFGGKIVLLNVVEPAIYPADAGPVPAEIDALYTETHNQARRKLAELAKEQVAPRLLRATEVRVGTPYQEILAVAGERKVDLIVIATHAYTAEMKDEFLGSTSERVARHAPCPVLTVREHETDFM